MVTPTDDPGRKQGGEEFVFAPPTQARRDRIVLSNEEARHLFRVRRVGVGAIVFATTGSGLVYECAIEANHTLRIVRETSEWGEPPVHLTLCMAMLKGDANREVVDIATQLGVRAIYFFRSEHSEGRLLPDKLVKLRLHAISAIKQCGRAWLPSINVALSLAEALAMVPIETTVFVANPLDDEDSKRTMSELSNSDALIVGPEGGLTQNELEVAARRKAIQLHLGARRLRAETAVAAGLTYLLNMTGEIKTN